MNKKAFFNLLVLLTCISSFGQNFNTLLGKAFTSQDSSDFYFSKAKKMVQSEGDLAEYYFCKNARCTDYNKPDSAVFYGNIALEKFVKLNKNGSALSVINNISKVYQAQGQYDKAIKITLQGLKIAENENNEYWRIFFNTSLARNYHDFEKYEEGVAYGLKGFVLAKSAAKPNNGLIGYALSMIAINYDDWNQPEKALYYHKKIFEYQKGKDTLLLATTYNNIGNTLLKQKKYKEAKSWFKRSLKINEITLVKKDEAYYYNFATVYTNLGTIAYKLNNFDDAETFFGKAKYFAVKSNNVEKLRDYYYQSAKFFKAQKDLNKIVEAQELYIKLRDSIFQKDRDKNFVEIETKYQTEKKEKQLLQKEIEAKNRNYIIFGLGLFSVFVALIGFLLYRQQKLKIAQQEQAFELKNAIFQIDAQNNLQNQRLAISKDLHDNIGAQLTFIISAVETTKFLPDVENSKLGARLTQISDFAKDTIVELRDTIWAMNTSEISFEDLKIRIYNFIEKAKDARNTINFSFEMDRKLEPFKLSSVQGMNIYRTIQEAINNSLKHANPNNVSIQVTQESNKIKITISDDGMGFNETENFDGNGLGNMEKRIREIGGAFAIKSNHNGTVIEIQL